MATHAPAPSRGLVRFLVEHDVLRLATLVGIAAFLADWASKSWALHQLDGTMPLGSLLLGVERNDAFAFSTGAGAVPTWAVVVVRLCALLALLLISRRVVAHSRRYAAGFGLMLGGGFGNAADLVFRGGAVVDFIGTGPFTFAWAGELIHFRLVFNGADLAILVGLGLLAPMIQASALAMQQRMQRWEARWLEGRA